MGNHHYADYLFTDNLVTRENIVEALFPLPGEDRPNKHPFPHSPMDLPRVNVREQYVPDLQA